MPLTLDEIANIFNQWCEHDSNLLRTYFSFKGGWDQLARQSLLTFVHPQYTGVSVKANQPVYCSPDEVDWVFMADDTSEKPEILAELTCESMENANKFEYEIEKKIQKLKKENLKEEFKNATRCVISLYFDVDKREYLHSKDFIEIFNNFEIGCAILRVK